VGKNFAVLNIFLLDIYRNPLPQFVFKYQSWYLTPYCGLEVHYLTSALKSAKDPCNTFSLSSKWARTLPSLIYYLWDIYGDPPPQFVFKCQSWYLTPCCRLEVLYPTYALKTVKDPGNTFNLSSNWASMCPSLIYFYWILIEIPDHNFFSNIKIDIWHPAVDLRCIIPPMHLSQLKTREIPLT
jgi:hypothetical protein